MKKNNNIEYLTDSVDNLEQTGSRATPRTGALSASLALPENDPLKFPRTPGRLLRRRTPWACCWRTVQRPVLGRAYDPSCHCYYTLADRRPATACVDACAVRITVERLPRSPWHGFCEWRPMTDQWPATVLATALY